MGQSQSYDLAQAEAKAKQGTQQPEEFVSPHDQFCRPVSMASTSSMRKPPKQKRRSRDNEKENLSETSSRTETPTSLTNEGSRESAIDVPKSTVVSSSSPAASPVPSQTVPFYSPYSQNETAEVVTESVLTRATELEKSELGENNVTHVEVIPVEEEREKKEMKEISEEKERAKVVAEEAVKQLEKKRGSVVEETLCKASEVEKTPLGPGGSAMKTEEEEEEASRKEQNAIDEATRQLDDALSEATHTEETSVIVDESSIEYATVSLARDEDISAIETPHLMLAEQKLFYTSQLAAEKVENMPLQSHYDKLNK